MELPVRLKEKRERERKTKKKEKEELGLNWLYRWSHKGEHHNCCWWFVVERYSRVGQGHNQRGPWNTNNSPHWKQGATPWRWLCLERWWWPLSPVTEGGQWWQGSPGTASLVASKLWLRKGHPGHWCQQGGWNKNVSFLWAKINKMI